MKSLVTKEMNRALNSYYRDIDNALVCGGREKREIVANIRNSVACYLSEHHEASIDDIYENFGSAKDVADEYYNNEEAAVIRVKIKRSRVIVLSVVIALILALLIYIAAIVTALVSEMKSTDGYDKEYVEETSQTDSID